MKSDLYTMLIHGVRYISYILLTYGLVYHEKQLLGIRYEIPMIYIYIYNIIIYIHHTDTDHEEKSHYQTHSI